nr:hypothetical protein [Escherichia coli]
MILQPSFFSLEGVIALKISIFTVFPDALS